MRMIFYILHHRKDQVSKEPTALSVLNAAIASDKYDLGVALQYASSEWLHTPAKTLADNGYMLTAAFLSRNAGHFQLRSRMLVLDFTDSYEELLEHENIAQFLPFEVIGELSLRIFLAMMG